MEFFASVGGRRGVAALGALALLALSGGYAVAVRARPRPIRIPLSSPAASKSTARGMSVHVAGAVERPGVHRLAEGSRVDDAVRVAGGPRGDADLDALNLATRLRDGDKVSVPSRAAAGTTQGGEKPAASSSRVNLNSATEAELDALPGIGPSLAQRIVAYREEHGGFRSVRDLTKVPGIGPRKFADLEERVTV